MSIKKNIFSYSIINIINSSVPFLLLPLLTQYLTPSDYGTLSLVQLLMMVTLPIMLINAHGLINIEYSKYSNEEFSNLITSLIVISCSMFLIIEFLFFLFSNKIISLFNIPLNIYYYIPLFVLFQVLPTLIPLIFQAQKIPVNFGKFKISLTLVNLIFSVYFVVSLQMSWEGRLFGIVVSFLIFTVIGIIILFKLNLISKTLNNKIFKNILIFGLPLLPHAITGVFLNTIDRVFISNYLDLTSVGIYSLAFQISSVIAILMTSINQAWIPILFEHLNNNPSIKEKRYLVITTYKIMLFMVFLTISFILVLPFIFDIFIDDKFTESKNIVPYIAIGFLFQGFYYMFTNYIFYTKKTKYLSYITVSSLFILIILNFILIEKYGLYGSAYALIATWFYQFISTAFISNRNYNMPWRIINV